MFVARYQLLMFTQEDFLFKFDLKSDHHLDIFEPHQKYLGFAWEVNNHQNFYVFTVLPFGEATACYTFTKLMQPLVRYWRGRGLRTVVYLDDGIAAVVYLDDGIAAVKGKDKAIHESKVVQSDLARAGLIVNIEKSQWVPTKSQWVPTKTVVWLGFQIDLQEGRLMVPNQKVKALTMLVQRAKEDRACHSIG